MAWNVVSPGNISLWKMRRGRNATSGLLQDPAHDLLPIPHPKGYDSPASTNQTYASVKPDLLSEAADVRGSPDPSFSTLNSLDPFWGEAAALRLCHGLASRGLLRPVERSSAWAPGLAGGSAAGIGSETWEVKWKWSPPRARERREGAAPPRVFRQ